MDCKEFRERLDLYADGELSAAATAEARVHLKVCTSCARAEARLLRLRGALKAAVREHQPPPELEQEVRRSLRSPRSRASLLRLPGRGPRPEAATPVWRARVSLPLPVFALLLAALVALGGWVVKLGRPAQAPSGDPAERPGRAASPAPPADAPGGFDFSRYYRGERASIQVVPRESLGGSGR